MASLALLQLMAACGSSTPSAESPVRFCVGDCELMPVAPLPDGCHYGSPKYEPNGTPTQCYYYAELNRVAPAVAACSKTLGVVAAEYEFAPDGNPRSLRATADCEHCQLPSFVEQEPFLGCVERAAAAARLPLAPEQNAFRVVFLYRVGTREDSRLDLGWEPFEPSTH